MINQRQHLLHHKSSRIQIQIKFNLKVKLKSKVLQTQDKQAITSLVTFSNFIKVGRSLGQGTFGKVRLGTHVLTGEKVAIKILEKDKIKDQSDVERVTREIHILKIVRHPNVVQLYEIIETSRQLFLIMEYASGGELFDFIVKRKRLQEGEACRFFQQIISGVEYIHKIKVCHRDLKPENLLLDDRNNIKIVDFGLSNMYKEGETLKTACGSPCYAAPEMIAGKRYLGLNSDIWSCGIILYAMSCGYLPFEDPNTNKLYKKILNCDYLIPGFLSANCKDLIKKILNTDPTTRITIKDLKQHDWFTQVKQTELEGIVIGKDKIPVLDQVVQKLGESFQDQQLDVVNSTAQQIQHILNNKHNQITSTYYLLIKKLDREQGCNLVFEAFAKDRRKGQSNFSSVNFGSPPKSIAPSKIIMNQTMTGGFQRAGPQISSKSDGNGRKTTVDQNNPVSKIYLEQIEKIYTKRTESTGQQRGSDSMAAYKTNQNAFETLNQSSKISQYQVIRATQSQSPKSKGLNIQSIQSNASAGLPNQTFYMAERIKRNNPMIAQRPSSLDNQGPIMITSTNDSRIQEMLPTVERHQQNRSVQMRSTMYNPNTQPSQQTQQYLSKINALINKPNTTSVNITDQKKQLDTSMNTTMYNTNANAYLNNNSVITKALAQTKVRKYRASNKQQNGSSIEQDADNNNNTSMMGMFTIYRPKKGPSINSTNKNGEKGNQSFDQADNAGDISALQSVAAVNNSFTAAPNSTASRFYNPHKHNRFLSNNYPQKQGGIPVFQNNFVLPMNYNTGNNLGKTFYGSAASKAVGTAQRVQMASNNKSSSPPNLSQVEQSYQSTATNSQTGYLVSGKTEQKPVKIAGLNATMMNFNSKNQNSLVQGNKRLVLA